MPIVPVISGSSSTGFGGILFGDLVQAVREAITDLPQKLPAPVQNALGQTNVAGGIFVPTVKYFVVFTVFTPWGESAPSNEQNITVSGGNNSLVLNFAFPFGLVPPSATKVRVYVGTVSGAENSYFDLPVLTSPQTVSTLTNYQTPPQTDRSYLPDTDGDAVNASAMFRWINDALKLGSLVCGGLLDYSGVGSITGVPQYIVPGLWKKIASMWYDGYPLSMDDNGNYFRRNAITASVLSSVAISTFNNKMMFELWPQPARSAALTTLANDLLVGQFTANLTSSVNFLLTNGFAKIGTEIVSYSGISGNVLTNLQRGLGGTTQVIQTAGSIVQELNLFWSGWRQYQPSFQPGSSLQTVPVPVGWETILFEYGLARMKLAEQNIGDYSKLNESCKKNFSDWLRQNKVVVGPRQIGDQTSGLETLPNLGGGWVVP